MKPCLLSADVDILAGQTQDADVGRLGNPYLVPIYLDEIRWMVRRAASDLQFDNFGNIGCQLRLSSNIFLTNGHVPIWLFGNQMQQATEEVTGTLGLDSPAIAASYLGYAWRLPTPLIVLPGEALAASFSREADGSVLSANVDISYAGRIWEPTKELPPRQDVPFVAHYTPNNNLAATTATSGNLELLNPFLSDLLVERLTSRSRRIDRVTPALAELTTDANFTTTIELLDEKKQSVVNLPLHVYPAFDLQRRAWTFRRTLNPRGFFTVKLANQRVSGNVFDQTQVALVGHRNEALVCG